MKRAYDVIVRVTVTADSPIKARRMVERFLPDPAEEAAQHVERVGHGMPGYACSGKCNAAPNYPIDSWALLTESKVIDTKSTRTHDRVTWQAVEVS